MAGTRSPQNPPISQLTLPPETITSCYPGIRHTEFQPRSGRHRQEKYLGQIHESGHHAMFFKPDGLITALRFGRDPDGNSFSFYHLEVWSSPIVGISQLQIDTTAAGQDRFSPISGRLSKFVSLPMNGTWGSWGFSPPSLGLTLSWPGKVINPGFALALQLPYLKISESMGNHDSKIVDAASVD